VAKKSFKGNTEAKSNRAAKDAKDFAKGVGGKYERTDEGGDVTYDEKSPKAKEFIKAEKQAKVDYHKRVKEELARAKASDKKYGGDIPHNEEYDPAMTDWAYTADDF
jgi:hypothetical protein